ncbi:UDP pyrophosphate phosphatase [Marinobacter daepoensis]|uniref:UDP pyrophosphate phosphatase n=1 Tax=Marinobacter daepoensis TaxID=262077 RepID=UPI0003FB67DE|nr:UDP pyrophosphate phosphatase [Marinobacter daepoensis]
MSRAPAADPQALAAGEVRRPLGAPFLDRETVPANPTSTGAGGEADNRRVDARRAAEDARLERFRADELPLPTARALSAFAGVAAAGQEYEGSAVLTGIDILV